MIKAISNTIWYYAIPTQITYPSDEVTEEIDSFGSLPKGWDCGEGVPSNEGVISNAKAVYFICKLQGFNVEPHPNNDGSITLIAFIKDHFLDIEIVDKSDKLKLRYEIGKGINYRVVSKDLIIDISHLEYVLLQIRSACLNSLETSTSKTIAQVNSDLETIKSSIPTKEAFQYSVNLAPTSSQKLAVTY